MAVSFAKSFILLNVLLFLATNTFATEESQTTQSALSLARIQLMRSLPAFKASLEQCKKKSQVIDIPHSDKLGISRNALLLGTNYFYLKAQNECLSPAFKDFYFTAKTLQRGLEKDTADQELTEAFELIDIIMEDYWRELEAEAHYHSEVSESDRAVIESIPCLNKPFDMIKSWNKSGN